MSELCRCSWDEVWSKPALEFLNLICYGKDKAAREKAKMEEWKKTH